MITSKYLSRWLSSLVVLLISCGTLVGNPEDDDDDVKTNITEIEQKQAQTITFNLADAPIDDAVSVFITVSQLDIKREGGDWIKVPLTIDQEVDLLKYQDGNSVAFAEIGEVEIGTYTETRFILSDSADSRIVLTDGSSHKLKIPGGSESGLKIKTPFTVETGTPVDLTLDFDLRRSLKTSGEGDKREYRLQPVLRLLKHGEYGHIEGDAPDGKIVCVYAAGTEPDATDGCENALNSAIVKDGKYKIPHLPKGGYKVQIFDKDGKVKNNTEDKPEIEVDAVEYKVLSKSKGKTKEKDDDKDYGANAKNKDDD